MGLFPWGTNWDNNDKNVKSVNESIFIEIYTNRFSFFIQSDDFWNNFKHLVPFIQFFWCFSDSGDSIILLVLKKKIKKEQLQTVFLSTNSQIFFLFSNMEHFYESFNANKFWTREVCVNNNDTIIPRTEKLLKQNELSYILLIIKMIKNEIQSIIHVLPKELINIIVDDYSNFHIGDSLILEFF